MTAKDLKSWREKAGYSRAELGSKLNTSMRNIESWEQERRAIPPIAIAMLEDLMRQDSLKIPLSPELRAKLSRMAKERGLDPVQWAAELIKAALLMGAILFAGAHLMRAPSNWSGSAMAATGKAGLSLIASFF